MFTTIEVGDSLTGAHHREGAGPHRRRLVALRADLHAVPGVCSAGARRPLSRRTAQGMQVGPATVAPCKTWLLRPDTAVSSGMSNHCNISIANQWCSCLCAGDGCPADGDVRRHHGGSGVRQPDAADHERRQVCAGAKRIGLLRATTALSFARRSPALQALQFLDVCVI